MSVTELQALSDRLLTERGVLFPYKVVLSKRKLTGGYISFKKVQIVVSAHMPPEAQENTLRHEVAHALAWHHRKHRGHGYIWRNYAREVGASTKARSAPETEALKAKRAKTHVEVACANCGIPIQVSIRRWVRWSEVLYHRADRGRLVPREAV